MTEQLGLFTPRPRMAAIGGQDAQLSGSDIRQLQAAEHKLLAAMQSGRWYGVEEMQDITGQREAGRRFRNIRRYVELAGLGRGEMKRLSDGRTYLYRLVMK